MRIISSSKHERDALCIPNDNQGFRKFMAKETYWFHMYEESASIISTLNEATEHRLPKSFHAFFRLCRSCHFVSGFHELHSKMKNAASPEEQPEIGLSAKRVVYRYFIPSNAA